MYLSYNHVLQRLRLQRAISNTKKTLQESNTRARNQQFQTTLSSLRFRSPNQISTGQIIDKQVKNTAAKYLLNPRRTHRWISQTLTADAAENLGIPDTTSDDKTQIPLKPTVEIQSPPLNLKITESRSYPPNISNIGARLTVQTFNTTNLNSSVSILFVSENSLYFFFFLDHEN